MSDPETAKAVDNLALHVYRHIRRMMINYEVVPGQRLIFSDLAKRLNVSRTPVNSALAMLAKEGFLDFVPNQGYTVHRISREEAESLYEILRIINEGAIARAIRKMTPEKLTLLEDKRDRCENAVCRKVNREQFLLDQDFHAAIIAASEIRGLDTYFRDVYQQIYLRISLEGLASGRAQSVIEEHRAIYAAIRNQDVQDAKTKLLDHLDAAKSYIFSRLFPSESSNFRPVD